MELEKSARSLEEEFFARENTRLLQEMRQRAQARERRAAMSSMVRVNDDALIDRLIELGLQPETVMALQLVPLAAVAWADGQIEPRERDAVLKAAAANGVPPGSVAGQMLDSWLANQPGAALMDAWKQHMQALWPLLSPKERTDIRTSALERAESVAKAAGSFLGLTSGISVHEKAVIDRLSEILAD